MSAPTSVWARPLTAREVEILQAAADGEWGTETAARLWLSHETIKSHRKAILLHLDVPNITAAVAKGIRAGIIS